jgi:hypothetical protein
MLSIFKAIISLYSSDFSFTVCKYITHLNKIRQFIALFSRVTSPLLLFAFAIMGGVCYGIFVRNTNRQVVIYGKEISLAQQYRY